MATEAGNGDPRLVVCAIDGSNADTNAVEVATQLAALTGARLALVAVAPTDTHDEREIAARAWTLEEALNSLRRNATKLDDRIEVDCYVDAGNPVRRLVEFAALTQPLLLVVGRNDSATGRIPSIVAGGLVRAAPCPVVVVSDTAPVPLLARPEGA
jgi:nucleotide-binding universal stress UspA family protein